MKITKYEVKGLNGRVNFAFDFHDDINILTGLNGAGKTTALKLAWYLLSGSTARVRNEIDFKSCRLVTDKFDLRLERIAGSRDIKFYFSGQHSLKEGTFDEYLAFDSDGDPIADGEDVLRDMIGNYSEKSIFFPTFRWHPQGVQGSRLRLHKIQTLSLTSGRSSSRFQKSYRTACINLYAPYQQKILLRFSRNAMPKYLKV
jgi:AAA domain